MDNMDMEPRMKKYPLTMEQCKLVLEKFETGVISTLNEDGYPYSVPVNFIYLSGRIYIHGRDKGHKILNIMRDSKCSFTTFNAQGYNMEGKTACDTETDFESVIVQGRAMILKDDNEKYMILRAIADKYGRKGVEMPADRVSNTGVIVIIPEDITGKYHKGP